MAIERQNLQEGGLPEELLDQVQETLEVELPEEMNIQGEQTTAFEVDPSGNLVPLFEEEEIVTSGFLLA